jgi:hypothetical protein
MRRVKVACRNGLAFVPYSMDGDDAAVFHNEPQHPRVQLADVPQLKQAATQRPGQRLAMVLAIPQLGQSGQYRRKIVWITAFKLIQKIAYRTSPGGRFIKLYRKVHDCSTSILMCIESGELIAGQCDFVSHEMPGAC